MKISIVTPLYNQAEFLPVCLRSVSKQTYQNIEHIVVDGGSTDGGIEILKEFQQGDNRLRYLSEPDEGQGDAVNKGFSLVTGDIVAWINSDDYFFSPKVFQTVCDIFSKHPEVDVVYGGMAWVDANNQLLHIRIPPAFDWQLLTRISYMGNTNTFFRKSVIQKHIIDKNYHYVLDHEFLIRVTRDFHAMRTKEILGCFRVQPDSKTQTYSEARKNVERLRRDTELRLKRVNIIKRMMERTIYRLQLFIADRTYLNRLNNDLPYSSFLT